MNEEQHNFNYLFSGPPDSPPLSGRDLAESGIESALQHVRKVRADYETKCLGWLASLPSGAIFTSETIRSEVGPPPEDCRNCLAGIMKSAKHLIVITDSTQIATRPSLHGKRLAKWRRL